MNSRFFLFILSVAFIFIQCSTGNNGDEQKAPEFPITVLEPRDTVIHRDYIGDIHAVKNVEIRARAKGYLDHIYVDEGQEVKEGQLLFQINQEELKSELAQAGASLKNFTAEAEAIQLEMERVKVLVEKNVLSPGELKLAQTKLVSANARIEEARSAQSNAAIRLSHATIKAPFDGMISRIPFKIGSLIDEGSLLTTVSDTRSVYAYFEVSENEYLDYITKLKKNGPADDEAELVLANGTMHSEKGKIETVIGEFQDNTGTIAFRAKFSNPDKIIKHGSSGKVRLSRDVKNVLMVPQKATMEIQDKTFVYIVDSKNQVKMKNFVPGIRFAHCYIVSSGLSKGDKIVYEGTQRLRDGMEIVPIEAMALSTGANKLLVADNN